MVILLPVIPVHTMGNHDPVLGCGNSAHNIRGPYYHKWKRSYCKLDSSLVSKVLKYLVIESSIRHRPGKQSDGETVNTKLYESISDILLYLTGFKISITRVTKTITIIFKDMKSRTLDTLVAVRF